MQGSNSKWVDDLCFHTYGEFSPPSNRDFVLRVRFEPQVWIWASSLDFGPQGWDFSLKTRK